MAWSTLRPSCLLLLAACGGVSSVGPDAGADAAPDDESVDYAWLFPDDRLVEIDLTMSDASWDTLMADPLEDVYVPATLTYEGEVLDVAVRLKGNSSRNHVQALGSQRYSFKVDIDYYVEGQKLHGVDKLNLNNGFKDPSALRERMATDLYRAMGIPTIRTASARLARNGTYWGMYTVVEQVDQEFLRTWFADDDGDLFKPEQPGGDLTWRGDSLADYPGLELETNEDSPDHASIIELLDVLNNTADADLEAALPEVLDVDGALRYLAVTVALSNLDSYLGSAHNYYLYQDRTAGRFTILPWDTNEAYGNFRCGMSGGTVDLIALPPDQPTCDALARRPLVTRLLAVASWRATYDGYLAELVDGPWAADLVYDRVHQLADLVRDAVTTDPTAFFSAEEFETNLDTDLGTTYGLTSFAERRAAALR